MNASDQLFAGTADIGRTDALVVVRRGELVLERYGDRVGPADTLPSWSMAKSILHAAVGILVAEGRLDLDAPAAVPEWQDHGDPRAKITLRQLLTMQSGLEWSEEPVADALPDVVTMTYGNNRGPLVDTAAFAADRPLAREPGTQVHYSSANSAIVSRIVRDIVGPGPRYAAWLQERLFEPVGITSAKPRFDKRGTWIASSFCFCTALDFARFGQLYLDGGQARGQQILEPSWVHTATADAGRDYLGRVHTMHWWLVDRDPWGAFQASGYLGQHLIVIPPLAMVVVRLGNTATENRHTVTDALIELIGEYA